MQIPPFTLDRQFQEIGSEIESEVSKVLKGGQYIGGQEIAKFEESFSNLIGVENTIGCNSGTDALVLALRALDIGVGDEVITSSFSFFATAEAISAVGANPVLVDIDPETYLINTELIEQEINSNTKAIMPVHLFGNAVNMTLIKSLAKKYDLKVIEDCAQATCTMWETSKVGSIGDIGCFSFFPTKNLGAAGDGGAVTTSDQKIAKKIRELAVHGSPIRYHHTQIGYNSRLDTIQAAILNIKIKYISKWINNRQKIANNYLDLLEKNPFISFPIISSDSISHSWNQFVIKLRNDKYFLNEDFSNLFDTDCKKYYSLRNLVKQQLFEKGINSIIYYPIPIHAQIAYKNKNFSRTKLINTERICTEVLSLPMFPEISYEEQVYVAENLNKVLKNCIEEIQISA
ncbi:putative pleiotropic regulatory protein [Prochlorococcus marinus str. MIT 9321]|uniref:Putative pleiotropic regulatory protein n=1 Tax=Prochlorococcus marinus str. MIT 9401 TaxID=167551 RepID=A0A0A2BBJ9_PROMR|nr:DegT/DnrJ/EryC1/StrS family aminotransferase [Prochlorococcus marinus]KGG03871.1 putative pleiotropic regulatory protein [Prochlorococcus marinus str. MIT 9321]KGG06369.1 putative pleiotropic regulatory protein [Prochlorococcus marinus str. MIT 9322]KGG10130.1 putative pleiotropic regulatory protein [Prochlorococcus marinus str. MIT 9401]